MYSYDRTATTKVAWRTEKKFKTLEEALAFLRKFDGKYFTEFHLGLDYQDQSYPRGWVLQYTYDSPR